MVNYRRRCVVCGMIVFLKNLERSHNLETFEYNYGGRGNIEVRKMVEVSKGSLINFWISRLEDVLEDLRSQKKDGSFGEWWRKNRI